MQRTVPTERLVNVLNTERGLSSVEADECARKYGGNHIIETTRTGWLPLILDTARDPMLWFLVCTAALFIFLGDAAEAITLFVAVIPLVGMDFYLHRRTLASTAGLASRLATTAQVYRDGKLSILPSTELVPGDLIHLTAGQNVPADGIFIKSDAVQLDESALTGEAYPVLKQPLAYLDPILKESGVDATHWAYAGTRLLTGTASVRIVYTGAQTVYGEIVRSATGQQRARTPLQQAITNLVGVLLVVAIILCLFLAWVRLQQGFGLVDALLSAVTLAVAALPEEFPVVFTFFLGVGVYRLAQRHALVRRAVVVENIGRVSCICSDKTGTITEGKLHLTHRYPDDTVSETRLLDIAAMASRRETADPMDLAILALVDSEHIPLSTFPFTEDRKRETAVYRNRNQQLCAASKGAPEVIFSMCDLSDARLQHWSDLVTKLAMSGHKVIACAERDISETTWSGGEPDRGFAFVGLLAFEDPVREGVAAAIQQCLQSGIHVLMVTGDHPSTAKAVATEVGLGQGNPRVIEASELEALLQTNPADLKSVDVIARAVPSQKLSLVRGMQSIGEVVAVTGDGVNDVPALQAADIGFAMGERGTRSAREVAAIVLMDDNFRTITRAIAEGRQLFLNLKMSFAYLLMIHIPLVLTAALIPLAGYPLLYLPIHIVWLELIIHPTALLVFQEMNAAEQLRPLRKTRRLQFFTAREWLVLASVGILITLLIIFGYEYSLGAGREVEHARAMTVLMLSFASAMLTIVLSRLSTRTARVIVLLTVVMSLLLVQTPPLAAFLHLKPLHLDDLMISAGGALGITLIAALARFGRKG